MMQTKTEFKDGLFRGDFGACLPIEIKEQDETGEFEGYGAIFDNVDQGYDVVQRGAFKESLKKWPAEKVRMLFHHDPRQPIGKYIEIKEDKKGLYVRGKLLQKVQRAAEVLELMREGAIEGLSMGYRAIDPVFDPDTGLRYLKKVDLREVSIVTFPMNELAGITLVKHDGGLPSEREFERFLMRDAGFSAQQAKAVIAGGYKSLRTERDAGMGGTKPELSDEAVAALRGFKF